MTRARTTSQRRQTPYHHPQDQRGGDPHHPQVRHSATPEPDERECGCRRHSGDDACCEHGRHPADTQRWGGRRETGEPPPGALRPLARALLSVAAEVHAERREVRRVTGSAHGTTLRMEKKGLRQPVH